MTKTVARFRTGSLRTSDMRGAVRLVTQATAGVTRIVENVHQSVWSAMGVSGTSVPGQTGGITRLVYRSIHAINDLLGKSVDVALAGLQPLLEPVAVESPRRDALLAALNGVLGDHLTATGNPLAIAMSLRYRGKALDLPASPMPGVTGKILVLIHGLCMSDQQWRTDRAGRIVDYGEILESAFGYTPVYLRYNSGLHVSQNGRELAGRLEQLLDHWPVPVDELSVVAHSMGGLLIRSAAYYAAQDALRWVGLLKNIVFLGTPHHGAPLERAGNLVDVLLGGTPFTAPLARIGKMRSAGITDLRYGFLLDDDWQGRDRFGHQPDNRVHVPLPENVICRAVAATTTGQRSALADRLIGDGLVPLHSALGQHSDARRALRFAKSSQCIVYRARHLELLSHPDVEKQLLRWLAASSGAA
jgi:pimeloyl-ACP methyl ester carboxylesterase